MARMPTTRWSLVLKAAGDDPEVVRRAVAALCEIYREPVLAFFQVKCGDPTIAEDLTQELLTSMVSRNDFARPDPSVGRFRNYLLGAAKHRWEHERRRARVRKEVPLQVDSARGTDIFVAEPATGRTPEDEYHAACARSLVAAALKDLEEDYSAMGAAQQFRLLLPYLMPGVDEPPYETIAVATGKRVGAVKTGVWRLRTRFRDRVRERVASTTTDELVEEELRWLAAAPRSSP